MRVPTGGVDKVDLVFMIDGSLSMTDKQELLGRAVPPLLSRFVNPLCVDDRGAPTGQSSTAGVCSAGTPEFPSVKDIHIAVITSNLGDSGGGACDGQIATDRAWLLPKARPTMNLASWDSSGFLAWDPTGKRNTPAGVSDFNVLSGQFRAMVVGVGEGGCGLESQLESWYRFLIDPMPPAKVEQQNGVSVAVGTDEDLLEQRRRFLRPDSLVAIVMLTDENDCSLAPLGVSWAFASRQTRLPRSTAICSENPNHACCRPCRPEQTTPQGCTPIAQDPVCSQAMDHAPNEDPLALRCWNQRRRFGFEQLEPVEKYIRGLTALTVLDRNGDEHANPLFAAPPGEPPRDPSYVFLAGILGVPWQDIATEDSLTGPGLKYLTAAELKASNRWDMILGDPKTGKLPTDPHMVESVLPRMGNHPLLPNAAIAPPSSMNPRADVISGHEQVPALQFPNPAPDYQDLQYACTFEREQPIACAPGMGCDCAPADQPANRPLCQPPAGGPAGTTQYYGKAYPGLRQLEVLRGLGDQAIVASICPKVPRSNNPDSDPNYGYNPAVAALIGSLAAPLSNQCLARPPVVTDTGKLSCVIVEARVSGTCDCTQPGRKLASDAVLSRVRADLRKGLLCGVAGRPACEATCACELGEADGAAREKCLNDIDPTSQAPGFCYIDPDKNIGNPALVNGCPGNKRRLLRFVGPDTPTPGSYTFMSCMGARVE